MQRLLTHILVLGLIVVLTGAGRVGRTPATPDNAVVARGDTVEVDVLANDGHLGSDLQLHSVSYTGARGVAYRVGNQVHFTAHNAAEPGAAVVNYVARTPAGTHHVGRLTVDVFIPDLMLHGEVRHTLPSCTIAVVIGDVRYPGCVSSQSFSIQVPMDDTTSVVTLEAELETIGGDGVPQRFASILGTLGDMAERAAQAGTPGSLSSNDYGPLRVDEFTTGHHTLLLQHHGAGLLDSVEALAAAEQSLDIGRLKQFAEVFRGTALGELGAFPPGVRDTVELAEDLDALSAFHAQHEGSMAPVRHHMINYSGHLWPEGMSYEPLLSPQPSVAGTIGVPFLHGQQVIVDALGEARVYDFTANEGSGASTYLDYSGLSIAQEHGIPTPRFGLIQCPDGDQSFEFIYRKTLQKLVRVVEGAGADVAMASTFLTLANGHEVPPECTHTLPFGEVGFEVRQVVSQRHLLPVGPVAALGQWALRLPAPTSETINVPRGNAGIIDFGAQTVDAPGFLADMAVEANDIGGMDLALQAEGDGGGVQVLDMQLFRVRADGQGGELWMANADNAALGAVGVGGLAAPVTHPDLFVDTTAVHGVWRSGFRVATLGMVSEITTELLFELQPGSPGVGTRYSFSPGGPVYTLPLGWEIDADGVLVMTTWQSTIDYQLHAWCPAGDECYPWQRRTWQPVSLSSPGEGPDRLYVIEELFVADLFADMDPPLISRRVNFYEPTVAPDLAPAPTPARVRSR